MKYKQNSPQSDLSADAFVTFNKNCPIQFLKQIGVSTKGRLLGHISIPIDKYYPSLILTNLWFKSKKTSSIGISTTQHNFNAEYIIYPERKSFCFNSNIKLSQNLITGITIEPKKDIKNTPQIILKAEYNDKKENIPYTIYGKIKYPYSIKKSQIFYSLYSTLQLNNKTKVMLGYNSNNNIELGYSINIDNGSILFNLETKPCIYSIGLKKYFHNTKLFCMYKVYILFIK